MDSTNDLTITTASAIASAPEHTVQQRIAAGTFPATAGSHDRVVGLVDVRCLAACEGTAPGTLAATVANKLSSAMAKVAEDVAVMAARTVEQSAAVHQLREQLRAIDGNPAAFGARLDALSRAQAATNNREIAELRQRLAAGASNAAFFIAKLHQSYRAQIAARDGEIAAKDELIVEVQRRAERLARQVALLEQKLADLRAHAEVVETQPVLPASHPGMLRRVMSWYRRLSAARA